MSFFDTLMQMIVILFAMAAGYFAQKKGILNQDSNGVISKLLLNVTVPALAIGSAANSGSLLAGFDLLSVLKATVLYYAVQICAGLVAAPLLGGTPKQKGVWRFALASSNMSFIGYPVVMRIFGADTLILAILLTLPYNILSYSLGPLMLAGAKNFSWKPFVSPCVITSVMALFMSVFRVDLPPIVGECFNFIGEITVPLSLILVGSLLAAVPVGRVFANPRYWLVAAGRLLIIPAILSLILKRVGSIDAVMAGIAVVEIAMPVAANGSMISLEYGGDTETVAQVTFLTTLLSIVTIPLVATMLL